jgi:predicted RNase H-like nuclease
VPVPCPSYHAFTECAMGTPVDWQGRIRGSAPNIAELLRAAQTIAGIGVDLIAIDMPIATISFSSRRAADNGISGAFGARGCSAHSPSAQRPGTLGVQLTDEFQKAGYDLVTTADSAPGSRKIIEVYPHPALLSLLRAPHRIPYKVHKSSRYWPGVTARERIIRLLSQFEQIYAAICLEIDAVTIELPPADAVRSLSSLKRYEDALDALVCGWVAAQFAADKVRAYGDATAAVWVPNQEVSYGHIGFE